MVRKQSEPGYDRQGCFIYAQFFFLAKLVIDQLVYDVALSLILE
jgi:hypothetical protein